MPRDAGGELILPMTLRGHIGSARCKDNPMFDEKPSGRDEYTYSGKSGTGIAWTGKTWRHFISRAPVVMDILKWAEGQGLTTFTAESFAEAVGMKLAEEQQMLMNNQLWGCLPAAVSGSADTRFKGADVLQGALEPGVR